jgi:hypothetical protein
MSLNWKPFRIHLSPMPSTPRVGRQHANKQGCVKKEKKNVGKDFFKAESGKYVNKS